MLKWQQLGDTNVLEFTLNGELIREDYDRLVERLEAMIEEHGKVRLIEVIRDIGRLDSSAVWKDIKWSPRHMKYFSHVAVVADQKWVEWMIAPVQDVHQGGDPGVRARRVGESAALDR